MREEIMDSFDQLRTLEDRVPDEYIRKLLARLPPIEEKLVRIILDRDTGTDFIMADETDSNADNETNPVAEFAKKFDLTRAEIESYFQSAQDKLFGEKPKKTHISLQQVLQLLRTKRAAN